MAELLIRVVNKASADIYQDCRLTKRGDVIVVCPDGWNWGTQERTNPAWRILKLPNVPVEKLADLTAEEVPTDPLNPKRTLLRRMKKIDVDFADLPTAFKNYLRDTERTVDSFTAQWTLAQIKNFVVTKQTVDDPGTL